MERRQLTPRVVRLGLSPAVVCLPTRCCSCDGTGSSLSLAEVELRYTQPELQYESYAAELQSSAPGSELLDFHPLISILVPEPKPS